MTARDAQSPKWSWWTLWIVLVVSVLAAGAFAAWRVLASPDVGCQPGGPGVTDGVAVVVLAVIAASAVGVARHQRVAEVVVQGGLTLVLTSVLVVAVLLGIAAGHNCFS